MEMRVDDDVVVPECSVDDEESVEDDLPVMMNRHPAPPPLPCHGTVYMIIDEWMD